MCIVALQLQTVDSLISHLQKNDFDLTCEGDLALYLGVQIKQDGDKLIVTQPGLTERIFEALGLEAASPQHTPATKTLGRDLDEPPAASDLNYRSIIGMLMYLTNLTRIDITFAVNQLARFSANPRVSHEKALKRLGRYLLGNKSMGLTLQAQTSPATLDCYVDADFAGLWGAEQPKDPSSVKSRSGSIITLGNNPIVWTFKLQTLIATSTMEAEYIAISTSLHCLLPLYHTYIESMKAMGITIDGLSTFSTVWEDNQAALTLANSTNPPHLTPRSMHITLHYHWFQSHLSPTTVVVKNIGTNDQLADQLTKPLSLEKFRESCKIVMGW